MPPIDPTTPTADEVRARVGEITADLEQRAQDLGERVHLDERIIAHPLAAIGLAFAVGAVLGIRRRPVPEPEAIAAKAGIGGAITGALAAIALRLAKDAALRQLSGAARDWYARRQGPREAGPRRPSMDASARP